MYPKHMLICSQYTRLLMFMCIFMYMYMFACITAMHKHVYMYMCIRSCTQLTCTSLAPVLKMLHMCMYMQLNEVSYHTHPLWIMDSIKSIVDCQLSMVSNSLYMCIYSHWLIFNMLLVKVYSKSLRNYLSTVYIANTLWGHPCIKS